MAVETDWGWYLIGGVKGDQSVLQSHLVRLDDNVLSSQLSRMWEIDFAPMSEDEGIEKHSISELKALQNIESSIRLNEGRYTAAAPWKWPRERILEEVSAIHSSRAAKRRAVNLGHKMAKDSSLKEQFFFQTERWLLEDYVERVPANELHLPGWYLPLHPVTHKKKPGKVRITHDAAAKTAGRSLNDFLMKGPDMVCSLVQTLLSARLHPVTFKADVADFFLRVMLAKQDRDFFRFWMWPSREASSLEVYRMKCWMFGTLSSPGVATVTLRRCASDHASLFHPETIDTVLNSTYLDDVYQGLASEEDAGRLMKEMRELLAKGGFRLTKMATNSVADFRQIPQEDRAAGLKEENGQIVGTEMTRHEGGHG